MFFVWIESEVDENGDYIAKVREVPISGGSYLDNGYRWQKCYKYETSALKAVGHLLKFFPSVHILVKGYKTMEFVNA